ncbi:MAG TPA: serine/threonine-protein kinase [Gemmatimonas sp.]|nr:serine/threonine-protein kinase [Gemmatimonas sp.]
MPDNAAPSVQDDELRAHVEQALSATYEVEQEIGRGGMGIVYRARDKRLKRHVAIKLLPPELSFRRDIRSRFLREAETAAQLSHPNIVPIYSVDDVGNLVFFVMACIEGDNLAVRLKKRGPCPVDDVRRWLTEVGDALAYAHSRGVIHRDIKPDNILLDGIDGRALVTDFGIARAAMDSGEASRLTATGMAIGTPAYMSPEQASGDRDLDARSDLYSLGIVAYQMLVGEPPFVGNTTPALLVKHLAEAPVPVAERRADVPPDLSAIVMRLLEKSPDQRFQTGGELVQALRSGIVPPTPMPVRTASNLGVSVDFRGPLAPLGGMKLGSPGASEAASSGGAAPYRQSTQYPLKVTYPEPRGPRHGVQQEGEAAPISSEEEQRWEHPMVKKFRTQFAIYLFVNVPITLISIFGGNGMGGITVLWTIFIAWKYAKLWSESYDWRDVLRQPHDRMFGELVSDVCDNVIAVFSAKKRAELRAQGRHDRLRGALSNKPSATRTLASAPGASTPTGRSGPARDDELGRYLDLVRHARTDRDEIVRLLNTIPQAERSRIPAVQGTAVELVGKIEIIAADLARFELAQGSGNLESIDSEISTLEAEANPLETARSETRVRRLAQLRRDRRAMVDASRKLETRRGQLESCRIALENVRLDLVRLRTGNSSVQSVTLVAEQAMALARDVDIAVSAAGEVRDATRGGLAARALG